MEPDKTDILKRLRRIEGQIKGIQRMIENEQCCSDVLIQIAAVRAATNKVGGLILENYSKTCIMKAAQSEVDSNEVDNLIETMLKFIK
jgi:DNA-binding FrmR family transcriptional regulator